MHFPVVFSLKVVGTVAANLEAIIVPVMQKNNVDLEHMRMSARLSANGNYTSFTVTFMAKSQQQLDDIYRALSSDPAVIIVL
ncbi:MAG TPA: DUF493 domain-containing protein [Gammaproteobacteria bacterium]|nr:DUF493 domain-containing protein [Gammaproteobacteria bacterium]